MNLLLDTHILLWVAEARDLLPTAVRAMMADPSNTFFFSVASVWEVAIKHALKRDDFVTDPLLLRRNLFATGYTELEITGPHAIAVAGLPRIHRDPFDRLLVAQAMVEGITLLTADPLLSRYPAPEWLV